MYSKWELTYILPAKKNKKPEIIKIPKFGFQIYKYLQVLENQFNSCFKNVTCCIKILSTAITILAVYGSIKGSTSRTSQVFVMLVLGAYIRKTYKSMGDVGTVSS